MTPGCCRAAIRGGLSQMTFTLMPTKSPCIAVKHRQIAEAEFVRAGSALDYVICTRALNEDLKGKLRKYVWSQGFQSLSQRSLLSD